jgi:hypothetical protein
MALAAAGMYPERIAAVATYHPAGLTSDAPDQRGRRLSGGPSFKTPLCALCWQATRSSLGGT